MRDSLARKITAAPRVRLSSLRPGDRVQGFEDWGCVPDNATRTVCDDGAGPYVKCQKGEHYLDGQMNSRGFLIGMCRIEAEAGNG